MIGQAIERLKSIMARAVIHLVNDEAGRQFVQVSVLAGEVKSDVERVQEFGFNSNPPEGSQAIITFLGSDRTHPIVIGTNDPRTRFNQLASGESAQYDANGQFLHMRNGGSIVIQTGGDLIIRSANSVRMETQRLEVTGDIIDQVDTGGQTVREMRETYNTHHHTGDDGGNTSDPHQQMGADHEDGT